MAVTLKVSPAELGGMLCAMHHPFAENMGFMAPLTACSSSCTLYPQGHPTGWRWPA